jgi:hypothetical protein
VPTRRRGRLLEGRCAAARSGTSSWVNYVASKKAANDPHGSTKDCRRRKKADEEGRTIVWVAQSGFYLLPLAVRTWAPRGHTPILRVPLTHDHLSAIGGLTPEGRLCLQTQQRR